MQTARWVMAAVSMMLVGVLAQQVITELKALGAKPFEAWSRHFAEPASGRPGWTSRPSE